MFFICHHKELDYIVQRGSTEVKDEHLAGRPVYVSTTENIDVVHDLTLEDRRIGLKGIAETLKTFCERIFHIVHHELGMRKLSAKWIFKCLNADQKQQRLTTTKMIYNHFEEDSSNF